MSATTPAEKHTWSILPFDAQRFLQGEVKARAKLTGEPGFTVLERVWARPTLEVLHRGIVGRIRRAPAQKTVIPAKATAKVSIRLVPNQDPEKVIASYKKFVAECTPAGIQIEVRILAYGPAIIVDPDHPAIAHRRQSFFGCPESRDGFHSQWRIDSDCGRFCEPHRHTYHPDGIWPS